MTDFDGKSTRRVRPAGHNAPRHNPNHPNHYPYVYLDSAGLFVGLKLSETVTFQLEVDLGHVDVLQPRGVRELQDIALEVGLSGLVAMWEEAGDTGVFSFPRAGVRDVGPEKRVLDPKQLANWASDLPLERFHRFPSLAVRTGGMQRSGSRRTRDGRISLVRYNTLNIRSFGVN
ncbi:hypothetical protein B0H10DRAFT_1964619 [Mycena sp. CBHHK59/15]|nr:hypothetical protein B0H10DRAFT_1964619 [Mycena sp. CBHHK59/15]